jgi:hypothetical protein
MDANDEQKFPGLLRQHFNGASAGDAKLVWDAVKGYSFDDAERAIIEHRKERGASAYRPDVKRIGALCAGYYRSRKSIARGLVKVVDELRQLDRIGYTGVSDIEVINTHFKRTWRELSQSNADPKGIAIMRAYMMSAARAAIYELGYSASEADDAAHDLVGLQPGEKIPRAGMWNVKYSAKSSFEALKDLAIASHALPSPESPSGSNAA